jgi:hypothetical protein
MRTEEGVHAVGRSVGRSVLRRMALCPRYHIREYSEGQAQNAQMELPLLYS